MALALLALLLAGCVDTTTEQLGGGWQLRTRRSMIPEAGGHHAELLRERRWARDVVVANEVGVTRWLGDDCVVYLAGDFYVACGDREPVRVFPFDAQHPDPMGETGFFIREVMPDGADLREHTRLLISYAEVRRRAKLQPPLERNWEKAPRCDGDVVNAIPCGDAAVRRVLSAGRTPAHDSDGRSALHDAVLWDADPAIVELLLRAGGDVNVTDREGRTPLMLAAGRRDARLLRFLLSQDGVAVNAQDRDGRTALMFGALAESDDAAATAVQLLLAHGASAATVDRSGWSAMRYASIRGTNGAVQLLRDVTPEPQRSAALRTDLLRRAADALIEVIGQHDLAAIERLVAGGADLNVSGSKGDSPLMAAMETSDPNVVAALLRLGARADKPGRRGVTPLMRAAMFPEQVGIAMMLARSVAAVDAQDDHGATALIYALRYAQEELATLLLARGANVNARDWYAKETPLLLAAEHGLTEIAKTLLAAGADPRIVDRYGMNALDRVILMEPNPRLEQTLREHGVRQAFGR